VGDIESVHIILFNDDGLPKLRAAYKEAVNNAIIRGTAVLVNPGDAADPNPDALTSHGHGPCGTAVNIQDGQSIGEASAEGLPMTANRLRPSDVEATEAAVVMGGVDNGDPESDEVMIGAGAGQGSENVSS
jgi:hypothetical protein